MKDVPGTCHYCERMATQNIVWLKDRNGGSQKLALPHCGLCNAVGFVASMWPTITKLREGVDYVFEPFVPKYPKVQGYGDSVTMSFEEEGTGKIFTFVIPRLVARRFADQVRDASHLPEAGCNDSDAHWHGHCGCK